MADELEKKATFARLAKYRYNPQEYIVKELGWTPWSGSREHPGQVQVLRAYRKALIQLHERRDYDRGLKTADQLKWWRPGEVIQSRIRVEAGHTVGKTKLLAGLVSHFIDTCVPSIVYSFAPTADQINDLLWKEIRVDRAHGEMPGLVLQIPELRLGPNHFAKGKATANVKGTGTERVQGQHGEYLMFVLDEAEGIEDYVWNGIESMTSGGISIVLMAANPRTRTSIFHKQGLRKDVQNFRISCVHHPNVAEGREVVPEAVQRQYVDNMLAEHAIVTDKHDEDLMTFEVPWLPGVIWIPDPEFMFRVLGVAPKNVSDRTFIPVGRWEAAVARADQPNRRLPAYNAALSHKASIGIDVARYGNDAGTIYVYRNARVWRFAQIYGMDSNEYYTRLLDLLRYLHGGGVRWISIRVDNGGGFGGGVVDPLKRNVEMEMLFDRLVIHEVPFNAKPADRKAYADLITEIYAQGAETFKGIAVEEVGELLSEDLTEREWEWKNLKGKEVRRLVPKDVFKEDKGHSPDDGDGCMLAIAPEFVFERAKRVSDKKGNVSVSQRVYGVPKNMGDLPPVGVRDGLLRS